MKSIIFFSIIPVTTDQNVERAKMKRHLEEISPELDEISKDQPYAKRNFLPKSRCLPQ